jgi:hypothetical protein
MTIKVAHIESAVELVINAGSKDGIEEGQRFQVYSMGEEITDPETGESLGTLEKIRGIGRITHVQDRIAILESDMTKPTPKVVRTSISSVLNFGERWTEEKILPKEQARFKDPEIGDLVRPV